MKKFIGVFVLLSLFLWAYSPEGNKANPEKHLPNRERILSGAQAVAAGPDFPHQQGSAASSKGGHFLYEGSFIVPVEEYRRAGSPKLEKATVCWEVFQKYGDFIRMNIDLDAIPEMIAKGGSSQYDSNSTRYDFAFEARDVTVIYDAEWFRGGPGQADQSNPEIQVRYHIRIN